MSKFNAKKTGYIFVGLFTALGLYVLTYFSMPGQSYQGVVSALSNSEKTIKSKLENHIKVLAVDIGVRNHREKVNLDKSAAYIESEFKQCSRSVKVQSYKIGGVVFKNIIATIPSVSPDHGRIVIGAHYDSAYGSPGANDNASGVAGILMLCAMLKNHDLNNTIEFVAFANEEPPFFQTEKMGSYVYVKSLHENNINVKAMISIEMIGAYYSTKNSQKYPDSIKMLYPDKGNFIAFVANPKSGNLVKSVISEFRKKTDFPSEGLIAPSSMQGIDWSDHWSFWQFEYPAIMVTDTAFYRYKHYHTADDTIDKIDFDSLTKVVVGLEKVIEHLGRTL